MNWLLAFHIIFVVTWFAGLFYLPRLFVYAATHPGPEIQSVFNVMQRKLLGITHIGGALAVLFGLAVILTAPGYYLGLGWLHAKLVSRLAARQAGAGGAADRLPLVVLAYRADVPGRPEPQKPRLVPVVQ